MQYYSFGCEISVINILVDHLLQVKFDYHRLGAQLEKKGARDEAPLSMVIEENES